MKIINIGILAHVDAGKTTLTESLLYTSGAILELGSVDKGTTRTDTMFLERQRGITIQAAVTSFNWNDYKINIVDTPGHTDFITEVYRSLSVLDGAILVISAKDGVQAQTRILFHALQKMNIPTIIFINKIDQYGINLNNIYQNIKEKLSNDIIVMQNVTLTPEISIKNIIDLDEWDPVISKNDKLLKKYIAGEKLTIQELTQEEYRCVKKGSLFPIYHGSAKNNIGTQQLIEAISNLFCPEMNKNYSELCGRVFKIEYTDHKQRLVYLRLYSGTLHLRDTIILPEKKKVKLTEIYIPSNGEMIQTEIVCSGDIFIIPNNTLRLNDIIGNEKILPCNVWNDNTAPILRLRAPLTDSSMSLRCLTIIRTSSKTCLLVRLDPHKRLKLSYRLPIASSIFLEYTGADPGSLETLTLPSCTNRFSAFCTSLRSAPGTTLAIDAAVICVV